MSDKHEAYFWDDRNDYEEARYRVLKILIELGPSLSSEVQAALEADGLSHINALSTLQAMAREEVQWDASTECWHVSYDRRVPQLYTDQ